MLPRFTWRGLWTQESGFSLLETLAATFIVGTVVAGTIGIIGVSAVGSSRVGAGVELQGLVREQIETIQQSPFKENPTEYPIVSDLPGGATLTFSATDPYEATNTDPGRSYVFPDGTPLPNVALQSDPDTPIQIVQSISVTATETTDQTTIVTQQSDPPTLIKLVQKITVTASKAADETTMSFYKVRMP